MEYKIEAEEILALTIDDFLDNYKATDDFSLYSGTAGITYFLASYLRKREYNEDVYRLCTECLEYVLKSLTENISPRPGLYNGIAGTGWLLSKLKSFDLIRDEAIFGELSSYFEKLIGKDYADNFSVSQGLSGMGIFLINQGDEKNHSILKTLVKKIKKNVQVINGHRTWYNGLTNAREGDSNTVETTLGNPGIIIFLLKLKIIFPDIACPQKFIKPIIQDLLKLKINNPEYSLYPFKKSAPFTPSRLSWMQGDFTMANLLKHYFYLWKEECILDELQSIGDFHLTNFKKIISKNPTLNDSSSDTSITSGSIGLYLTCSKVFEMTGLSQFAELRDLWLDFTFKQQAPSPKNPVGFYNVKMDFETKELTHEKDFGLFNGLAGMGMFCMDYLNNDNTSFDDLLLL